MTMGAIYLRPPTEVSPSSRRHSDVPSVSSESISSFEVAPRDSTISNLHAIDEEEEEEDILATFPVTPTPEHEDLSPTEKSQRRNSSTEPELSENSSGLDEGSPTLPKEQGFSSSSQEPPSPSTMDDADVVENAYASDGSD